MGKTGKVTKTELFLLLLTAVFLLSLLAMVFVFPGNRGSYEVVTQRTMPAEEEDPEWRLDLNAATAEQLQELEGIGPVLAERIVAYRDTHGAFTDVEQLLAVEGIGEKILDGIRDILMIEVEP